MTPDLTRVVPVDRMAGEDQEDTASLNTMLQAAEGYITSRPWCARVQEAYWGLGVGGVVAVFLFRVSLTEIAIAKGWSDEWAWVVVGDLPPAYLVSEVLPNPACALQAYVVLLGRWVSAASKGQPVDDLIPVNVPATPEWAAKLGRRLEFLKNHILSEYESDLAQCRGINDVI